MPDSGDRRAPVHPGLQALGEIPTLDQMKADLPNLITPAETEVRLAKRLAQWRGE